MQVGDHLSRRYRLDRRLGHGAMGEVWQAYDVQLSRAVAVKVLLRLDADQELLDRFRREAEIGARLQHPGIAVVHDVGKHEDRLFIVMELLEGSDLAGVLDTRRPGLFHVPEALGLGLQVAEALAAAHAQGVVHRDLKPANLFRLTDGRVKICDFGIARTAKETKGLTVTGRPFGTPTYMAPEQWRGEHVDARCDVYALGCVLQELLTGAPPFRSTGEPWPLMRKHVEEDPPRLRSIRAEIPDDVDALVASMLAKVPASRPSASAVAARLRTVLTPTPQDTGPGRRTSFAVISLALAVVVLLGTLVAVVFRPSASGGSPSASGSHSGPATPPDGHASSAQPSNSQPSNSPPISPSPSAPVQQPLDPAELLPAEFKDSAGADFLQAYNKTESCAQASQNPSVNSQFKADGCTTMMTGDYLEQTRSAGALPILVSVQVIPFPSVADADKAYGFMYGADYPMSLWCPPEGVGHDPCAQMSQINWKNETAGTIRHVANFLIESVTLRTDHSSMSDVWHAIVNATWAGAFACGPSQDRGGTSQLVSWS